MSEQYSQISMFKKLNNTNYTYKSSQLIESSYELSLTEQRLVSLACKMIQPIYIEKRVKPSDLENILGAMKFSKIKISVNEFRKEYNIKANNIYEIIAEASADLYERNIRYYDENGKLTDKRWVSTSVYDEKNKCVNLTFNPDMILDLLVFKGKYVALFFDMSQNIRSKYAFRLYEILKNYAYLGKYKVSIDELKFMLAIDGAYSSFAEFNRNVIKPNIEAINTYSDINVECKPLRSGRNITSLEFYLSNKVNKTFSPDNNFKDKIPNSYNEISKQLEKHGVTLSSSDAEMLFNSAIEFTTANKKDTDATSYILEKICVLDEYVKTKDVEKPIGFLKWAIETNFEINNQSIKKKNNFKNFTGRDYSDDYWNDLECQLLGWNDEEDE